MDLSVWSPLRVEDGTWLRWWSSAGAVFDDPFWVDTVRRRLRNDAVALLQPRTRLSALPALVARHHELPLAGLVLHWSRSGSTAFLRAAGSSPQVLALSEPPLIDEVLRTADPGVLPAMVAALTQPRDARQTCAVLKLDAWSALQLPLLREALPGVPWAFVWRDPELVLRSHAVHGPGAHMVPGVLDPRLFGLTREDTTRLPLQVYRARVLRALARAALGSRDSQATFVEHCSLADQLPAVLDDWGVPYSPAAVSDTLRTDAKSPGLAFDGDGEQPVPDDIREACLELTDVVAELRGG